MKTVEAWVDGACAPNPGRGSWGAVLKCNGHVKEIWGPQVFSEEFENQTNNRMELIACIEVLRALREPCKVILHSDSNYVIQTMLGRWRTGSNLDLWQILNELALLHEITWSKVRTHLGDNTRAHHLANRGLVA